MGANVGGIFVAGEINLPDEWILEHLVGATSIDGAWMREARRKREVWIGRGRRGLFIGAFWLAEPLLAEEPDDVLLAKLTEAFPDREIIAFERVDFSNGHGFARIQGGARTALSRAGQGVKKKAWGPPPEPLLRDIAGLAPWDRDEADEREGYRENVYTLYPNEELARLHAPPKRTRIPLEEASSWVFCLGSRSQLTLARVKDGRFEWRRYDAESGYQQVVAQASVPCDPEATLLAVGQDGQSASLGALRLKDGSVEIRSAHVDGSTEHGLVADLDTQGVEVRAAFSGSYCFFLFTERTASGQLEVRRASESGGSWTVDVQVVSACPTFTAAVGVTVSDRCDVFTLEYRQTFEGLTMVVGRIPASCGWESASIVVARLPAVPLAGPRQYAITRDGRAMFLDLAGDDAVEILTTIAFEP